MRSSTKSESRWIATIDTDTDNDLPTYDPLSQVAKRERARLRFAENAIHVIPVVVVLCGVILWFFSHPALPRMAS